MIEIKNVGFRYGKGATVLEQLNLHLKPGSIYGLLGENGVGKTTLLKMMAGLLFPNEGDIRVLGFEPRKREAAFLQQIYFLPDSPQVEEISLERYAKLNACLYPNFSEADLHRYVSDLDVDSRRAMHKLSFGQQKKAMLAFALACNTPVLLMDEPTNGLDIPSKSQLRRLIASAATEDKCFVISTHQVRDLEQLIDPVVIMERQRVLLNDSLAEIDARLWFGVAAEKPENCLYAEPAMGGYYVVTPRTEGMPDSKVQLEALFNAAIANRAYFQETFGQNGVRGGRTAMPDTPSDPTVVEHRGGEPASPALEPADAPAVRISPFKRFGCFLWAEMFTKYKQYFLMLGIILGLYLWNWMSYLFSAGDFASETVYGASRGVAALWLTVLSPYILYRDLYHPVKGFSFMMRPAGNVAKFAAIWLQSVVIVPVLLLLWCGLLDGVVSLLTQHTLGGHPLATVFGFFHDDAASLRVGPTLALATAFIFGPQASVLWGTCFFKRHKLLKLMATYFVLTCLASWLILRLAVVFPNFELDWLKTLDVKTTERWLEALAYTGVFSLCIGLYVWSFFSFRRRQL